MASIRKQIHIDTNATDAWDALRDFGALHQRLAAGFATDTQLDGRDRIGDVPQRHGAARAGDRSRR